MFRALFRTVSYMGRDRKTHRTGHRAQGAETKRGRDCKTARPHDRTTARPQDRKTARPQDRKTARPQDRKTARPQDRKTARPQDQDRYRGLSWLTLYDQFPGKQALAVFYSQHVNPFLPAGGIYDCFIVFQAGPFLFQYHARGVNFQFPYR